MKIKVHRHPDGRIKSIEGSTENYEFWIDENGTHKWMRKDEKFDKLILKLMAGHKKAVKDCSSSDRK